VATRDETHADVAVAEQTLEDERRRRVQAGASALAAGILTMAGGALAAIVYSGLPTVPIIDALRERLGPGEPEPGVKARQVLWYDDNALALIGISIVLALAAAAIGLTLAHLYRSTKARRPELSRFIIYAAVAGAVFVAVAGLVQAIGVSVEASSFAGASDQTSDAAGDVLQSPVVVAALLLRQLGVFALGFAFVLLALNAMRVGLLTRFMGVLGIIVGVLFIIPLGSSLPIVQAFWLCALGALFLGKWQRGLPPAWVTGEAQPWPTQQALREARMERQAEKAESRGGEDADADAAPKRSSRRERADPPETPAPLMPERRPHPSSKKRKRKRR
jgi:F0F1-type ATP synthase membrane subunit c/vacuolar-type H+-ATPase subunit K